MENVTGPADPPSDTPDPLTQQALSEGKARSLSPTDRLMESHDRHLTSVDQERQRLLGEATRLQGELDKLRPAYEGLKANHASLLTSSILSVTLNTAGGALMSGASFLVPEGPRYAVLFSGLTSLGCGLVLQFMSVRLGDRPTKPRRPSRP